jgi:hypothetical protein
MILKNSDKLKSHPDRAPSTVSSRLRQKITEFPSGVLFGVEKIDISVSHYVDYLCIMHQIIRASVPLMALAIEHCDQTNPVHRKLSIYLEKHVKEENGHPAIVLSDLRAAGIFKEDVLARSPHSSVVQMVGSQYYWILHHSPIALLGYIAFLEGSPPTAGFIEFWKSATDLPKEAFASLALHAVADLRHNVELYAFIDDLNLDKASEDLIGLSAMQTAKLAGATWTLMVERWKNCRG